MIKVSYFQEAVLFKQDNFYDEKGYICLLKYFIF